MMELPWMRSGWDTKGEWRDNGEGTKKQRFKITGAQTFSVQAHKTSTYVYGQLPLARCLERRDAAAMAGLLLLSPEYFGVFLEADARTGEWVEE